MYPVGARKRYIKYLFYISLFFSCVCNVGAVQYSIESDIAVRAEYNDNIFLTPLPHEGVYALTVIPAARTVSRGENWETSVNAKLKSSNYSDQNLDGNDIFLDASGNYQMERNRYTLDGAYYKDSNLNALSSDFGITGRRVNRALWYVAPQYTRLLSERASVQAGYNHTDVDYEEVENTGFVPYKLDTLNGAIFYNLTERNNVSFSVRATDYESKDGVFEYQLFITQLGAEHKFTELWSMDFAVGGSRRNSTNNITITFDILGEPVPITEQVNFSDKGYVLNAGVERKLETGVVSARISRDDVTNSQGGLNEVNSVRFDIRQNISELLQYSINARYEDIDAVATVTRQTDRTILFFEPKINYAIDRHWSVNASYRYAKRKFKSSTSDESAPSSNRIYIGMTYNFPDISTF